MCLSLDENKDSGKFNINKKKRKAGRELVEKGKTVQVVCSSA